jgi:hypothetical protein
MEFIISKHAKEQIEAREIPISCLLAVSKKPDQTYKSLLMEQFVNQRLHFGEKTYLLRVFIDFQKNPPVIISVYRTSNIKKYWRKKNEGQI